MEDGHMPKFGPERSVFGRWLLLALCGLAIQTAQVQAQDFRGRIMGVVKDTSDALLPGVTVTAHSPALIQPQSTVTGEDGTYRLIALPAGVYDVTFEISGFRSLKRADIRVVINATLTLNVELEVAQLQETVTVSGASPVVDTSTTTVGTNFVKELLTEIPNARDVWAAMAQAPGFQMTGFDVGGSHTGTQTGYMTFGVMSQHTTKIEGINATEAVAANGGYFDFGSFEEFQVGGSGHGAEQDAPGASLNISIKAGGDRFSGTWYSDFENDKTISDNVPEAFETANTRDEDGFFVRTPLTRGNPIDKQYDINADIGGPIQRQKAWFYYSYRLNDQYKYVLNFDELAQSKLSNLWTVKGTYQLSRNNQLTGYTNQREKLQALRDLGPLVPVSAAYHQSSKQIVHKGGWTSVLNDRMFLDVIAGTWINKFPLRPTTESGAFSGEYVPGRVEISTTARLDGGPNITYQDQRRNKPQYNVSLSYFKNGWGSHNFKFGSESRWEERAFFADQPYNLVYYDTVLNRTPSEVEFYNTPNDGINNTNAFAAYVSDNWRVSDRVSLNLGLRFDRYRDFWPEQTVNPGGVPELAGTTDPRLIALFAPREVAAQTVSESSTFGPRVGLAYDVKGNGRSVLKAYYGRFYFNSAPDTIAAQANPVGRTRLRYRWNDLNGNLRIDDPEEAGTFLRTAAGPAGVTIDQDLERPFGDEYSVHYEQEVLSGLSARASYVRKNLRNEWNTVDLNRINAYITPFPTLDRGPDNALGTGDDQTLNLLDRVAAPENQVFTNVDEYDSDYDTVEFALNRRFRNNWMLMTSYGHTWLKQFHGVTSETSALASGGQEKNYDWRPNFRTLFGRETSTTWNYKIIGRYVAKWDIGISGSYKLQSGRNWGRTLSVTLPVAGNEVIRVEPMDARRAPNVGIWDMRFDKSFGVGRTKLTAMVDIFNLANAGTVTGWQAATGATFQEALVLLDPRIVRFGVRMAF
jgi:hypothetical protein